MEGAIMQLAPSLHRLGRSSLVNSYLIEDAAGITIIDAGLPGHWKDLGRELTAMGRSFADIRALLLTHGDVDHVGFAERLRRDHAVPVHVGEADTAEARGEVKKPPAARDPKRIWPLVRFLAFGLGHGGLRATPIREVLSIGAASTLEVPGAPHGDPAARSHPGDRLATTCPGWTRSSWATP
jgi:glyoxylase-like metal-dependent hydrolase (beta-lactamase superfamily II)